VGWVVGLLSTEHGPKAAHDRFEALTKPYIGCERYPYKGSPYARFRLAVDRRVFDCPAAGFFGASVSMLRRSASMRLITRRSGGATGAKCDGGGRYSLGRLIDQHGRDRNITDWFPAIGAVCPRKRSINKISEPSPDAENSRAKTNRRQVASSP
jgi:hypothetical protein